MSNQSFLSMADSGKNSLWRYVLGVILIIFTWIVITAVLVVAAERSAPSVQAALGLLGFLPMLVMPLVVTRVLHGRPAGTLIGPAQRLNWGRIGRAMLVWAGMSAAAVIAEVLWKGLSSYRLNVDNFLSNLTIIFIYVFMIPIQATAEEVFFRGYLLQATGRLTRNWVILGIMNSLFFMLPHLANPEARTAGIVLAGLNWLASGMFYTLLTLRSGSLDYAIGAHVINNVLSATLISYPGGALGEIALVMTKELDAAFGLVTFVVAAVIAYVALTRAASASAQVTAAQRAEAAS
jgi:membrane protease YdiL (CAAX protease family)